MVLDRAVIDVLVAVAEVHPEHLARAAVPGEDRLDLGPGERGAERDPQGADLGVPADPGALHAEVGHALAVLLETDVADASDPSPA